MKIGILGTGKIGKAFGGIAANFCEVVFLDKMPPYGLDYSRLSDADMTFICVNTTSDQMYDMSNVDECLRACQQHSIKNVVILSTCPPSFFNSEIFLTCKDFVTYNPLFIRQGTIAQDIINAEIVLIGGATDVQFLTNFYKQINHEYNFIKLTHKEAAIVKMGINGFLTLKVAYANMIGDFCVSEGIDPDAVLAGIAASRSVNNHYFKYGHGYGGPCLPIDNRTLAVELSNEWPNCVDEENNRHLRFMVQQFIKTHPDKHQVIENVGYKKGVPIITNSQQLIMAVSLVKAGYDITIRDEKAVCDLVREQYPGVFSFDEI